MYHQNCTDRTPLVAAATPAHCCCGKSAPAADPIVNWFVLGIVARFYLLGDTNWEQREQTMQSTLSPNAHAHTTLHWKHGYFLCICFGENHSLPTRFNQRHDHYFHSVVTAKTIHGGLCRFRNTCSTANLGLILGVFFVTNRSISSISRFDSPQMMFPVV